MLKRKSPTVTAVRAEATRVARGESTIPEDNQSAAERRAMRREASNDERRQHAQERVQMRQNGPGAPDRQR
ncbi:hypothetical protein [Streptomyces sp. NPDC014894]|uniref:hypothetical protein n=1 Tax=Streptomyces sp. NPDC014894 TaxID=3364931 RepID=UPI0036F5E373